MASRGGTHPPTTPQSGEGGTPPQHPLPPSQGAPPYIPHYLSQSGVGHPQPPLPLARGHTPTTSQSGGTHPQHPLPASQGVGSPLQRPLPPSQGAHTHNTHYLPVSQGGGGGHTPATPTQAFIVSILFHSMGPWSNRTDSMMHIVQGVP